MNDSIRGSAATRGLAAFLDRHPGRIYVQPLGITGGGERGGLVRPLAGGPLGFTGLRLLARGADRRAIELTVPVADALALAERHAAAGDARLLDSLTAVSARRAPFAELAFDRPRLMGIVNVTPDSFSDGGRFLDPSAAIAQGRALAAAGCDILDVGGESTRPGAAPAPVATELARVRPVIDGLRDAGAALSVDTRRAAVIESAAAAGAVIVNDVSALEFEPEAPAAVARLGLSAVLMHMRGEPATMQDAPAYDDVRLDVHDYLAARIAACEAAGIPRSHLAVDPGIGFGKTVGHNIALLQGLGILHDLGCPIVVGVSRKSFIGRVAGETDAAHRFPGSLAAGLWALGQGAQILRVHDGAETAQALAVWRRLVGWERTDPT